MSQTVLVIEDEQQIAHWVRAYFEEAGFRALVAADGPTGLHIARAERPDLLILDLMLPGMDGLDVCRTLRRETDVPIIILTARGRETDRILGLELGADDYVVKPFSPGELVARARAVLRRAHGEVRQPEMLRGGEIVLDIVAHTCTVRGQPVELSPTQFALLEALMRNSGRALTREQLLKAAMDAIYDGYDRTVDVHIRRLRRRVEADPSQPRHIVTVFGVGYKFVE
jgi:two-component system alkaline phosphatase synthesis response regulator PhoP